MKIELASKARQVSGWVASVVVFAGSCGCSSQYATVCNYDTDCNEMQICVEHKCIDNVCPNNCLSGQYCASDGCRFCKEDNHCGANCLDCTVGARNVVCVNGICGCRTELDCAAGETCAGGLCQAPCLSACGGRQCGPDPVCGTSCGDCTGGAVCQDGTCTCQSHDSTVCKDGNVWWFDSCARPESQLVACANGCADGVCSNCPKDCGSRVCGPDPQCGQSCGDCFVVNTACNDAGQCVCQPGCGSRVCGLDPICGTGTCGDCTGGKECQANGSCICVPHHQQACNGSDVYWYDSCGNPETLISTCANGCADGACLNCVPQCGSQTCGPDPTCGQTCGNCGANQVCQEPESQCACRYLPCNSVCCAQGEVCVDSACCSPNCSGRVCGSDPNCGVSCGPDCGQYQRCNQSGQCECQYFTCNGTCCASGQVCANNACCTPNASTVCHEGDVYYVDSCGNLGSLQFECPYGCQNAQCQNCQPDCSGRVCGPDPVCGASCGPDCVFPARCIASTGQCCTPNCAGKCGGASDGCPDNGTCTQACPSGQWCNNQACVACNDNQHCGTTCINCSGQSTNKACYAGTCGCYTATDCLNNLSCNIATHSCITLDTDICDNEVDDDGDQLTDCEDTEDCSNGTTCRVSGIDPSTYLTHCYQGACLSCYENCPTAGCSGCPGATSCNSQNCCSTCPSCNCLAR